MHVFVRCSSSILSAALVVGWVGCASAQKAPPSSTVAQQKPAPPAAPAPAAMTVSVDPELPGEPIYFEFDSDAISEQGKTTLKKMATYLQAKPQALITIAGHCDDVGTPEYNLSLGDRRAKNAREYLSNLGVPDARIHTISFGEEKPAVADSTPEGHAKNRRGEMDVKQAPKG